MLKRNKTIIFLFYLTFIFGFRTFGQNTEKKEILWAADWSPNGKYIALGGNIDTLKIYKKGSLNIHLTLPVRNTITNITWHPYLNIIAVSTQMSDEKCFIFNVETKEKIELIGISSEGARGIGWNYTGEYLGVADNSGQILIYEVRGHLIRKFVNEYTKSITALDWHPKKNIITTVGDKIRFFDIEGNLLQSVKHRQEDVLLLSIAWHKSGDFFVTGDYGDKNNLPLLQYWNNQCELLQTIDIGQSEYRNLAWNPKGDRLASASDALRIWDIQGNLLSTGISKDDLWGVAWNEKGNRIVTSSQEQKITLWNNKGKIIKTIETDKF